MDKKLNEMIIKMDNNLTTKATRFNATQQKLFYSTLASLENGTNDKYEVEIDKKDLLNFLGYEGKDKWDRLRYQLKQMVFKSFVEFGNDEMFCDGFVMTNVRSTKHKIYVQFGSTYLPLVKELSGNYTRLLNDDTVQFKSKYSMMLYQILMKNNNYRTTILTTKELKELFGLSKDDYCNKKTGKFDRYNFDKYTIDLAVKEINEMSRCISNLKYRKNYHGRQVANYEFHCDYTDPNIAVRQIETENRQAEETLKGQTELKDFGVKIEERQTIEPSYFEWWNEE